MNSLQWTEYLCGVLLTANMPLKTAQTAMVRAVIEKAMENAWQVANSLDHAVPFDEEFLTKEETA